MVAAPGNKIEKIIFLDITVILHHHIKHKHLYYQQYKIKETVDLDTIFLHHYFQTQHN